ncbi:hypothetical protein PF005_g12733 [Phytophthora fragariae]|uniref:RxLR effector protein n=1 Tax=Phytophthora fragariae TaxID=53985 RepID=A0A6A4DRJ2_9STRA|nr:hypothetical protein PF003_g31971 [Phytophthora fragariae]KAE8936134.1 hypothetical protein PF009_g13940 [Phytophthora fragariae]KAE9107380.1 hypothetical protein PF010_g12290 [Phytophthora fragariae]KAE9107515.1 hypothetical protein PF007_g13018 [Phytophthora fragariae]KAE9142977.1 hypothetical protein PF006_g11966 [Phytophthora fragariae]
MLRALCLTTLAIVGSSASNWVSSFTTMFAETDTSLNRTSTCGSFRPSDACIRDATCSCRAEAP